LFDVQHVTLFQESGAKKKRYHYPRKLLWKTSMIKIKTRPTIIVILVGSVILSGVACNITNLVSEEEQAPPSEPNSESNPEISPDELAAGSFTPQADLWG
jgi:hypothetical protein